MKKVLLASTALMLSTGFALADVSVGGSGRMGIVGGGVDDTTTAGVDETELSFTSRIRISFSASGETDAGLQFGGSIRADNASDAGSFDLTTSGDNPGEDDRSKMTAGSVFVSGTFGTISMGDVSGAPEAAVGDLSGVGLTGLGDKNELTYLSNADRPAARWDYTVADLGLHISADNPGHSTDDEAYGIAVTYSMGDIGFGIGYEDRGTEDHTVASVTAGLGDLTAKLAYGAADLTAGDFTQMGVSVDFVSGATTFTAFWINKETDAVSDVDSYGLGVSYDLGGGAAIKAGFVDSDDYDDAAYDLGISMSF